MSRGSNGNVIGVSHSEICPEGFQWNVPIYHAGCVQRGFNCNALGGGGGGGGVLRAAVGRLGVRSASPA